MTDLFIALVIFLVSCQWAMAGVVLMNLGRENGLLGLADWMFLGALVVIFNLVSWSSPLL